MSWGGYIAGGLLSFSGFLLGVFGGFCGFFGGFWWFLDLRVSLYSCSWAHVRLRTPETSKRRRVSTLDLPNLGRRGSTQDSISRFCAAVKLPSSSPLAFSQKMHMAFAGRLLTDGELRGYHAECAVRALVAPGCYVRFGKCVFMEN